MPWGYIACVISQQAGAISKEEWEKIEGKIVPWEEWEKALDMNEGFTLSKDRPWTIKNYIAWAISKLFL